MMDTQNLQIRDNNGYVVNTNHSLGQSLVNQDATLTISTVKTFTVPSGPAKSYTAIIKYTLGADVLCIPAAAPTLTAPSGTVRTTTAMLRPEILNVLPGQTLQFIYANTVFTGTTVTVSIAYYANNY
jgi:hypothetical protein